MYMYYQRFHNDDHGMNYCGMAYIYIYVTGSYYSNTSITGCDSR